MTRTQRSLDKNLSKLTTSTTNFSKNFYMNRDDINKLLANEMLIGSQTFIHVWLGYLT